MSIIQPWKGCEFGARCDGQFNVYRFNAKPSTSMAWDIIAVVQDIDDAKQLAADERRKVAAQMGTPT